MEQSVGEQVRLEVTGASVHDHVGRRGRHRAALIRGGPPRSQRRRRGLESAPQLRQGHQLGCPVSGVDTPSNEPGIEHVPVLDRQDGDSDAAAGFDHTHRLQHPHRLARDASGDPVPRAHSFEGEDLTGWVLTRHDRRSQRSQQTAVEGTGGLVDHTQILSYVARRHLKPLNSARGLL